MDNSKFNELDEFRRISFSELSLSIEHDKLLKRICKINRSQTQKISETIGGILDLETYEFSKMPAIGKLYVDSLITLKKELLNGNSDSWKEDDINFRFCIIPTSLSELHLNYQYLKHHDIKLIVKLTKLYGQINIEDIIELDAEELKTEKGISFGTLYLTTLKELQNAIRKEIIYIIENKGEPSIKRSRLLVSSKIEFYDLSEIDEILIEDIENYLWSLDDKKQDIALSRWGFNQKNETLEEVGERHEFTRERTRQIEKQINTFFPLYLRISPKVLWANIRENMGGDLRVQLPSLSQCFDTEKTFYTFIELCCQIEKGSLIEIVLPMVKSRLLEPFFCLNPSPVDSAFVIEELTSEFGFSRALAQITIRKLVELGSIIFTEYGIEPQSMGNKEAIAHVLTFHPKGLPWKDIAKIANKKKYSKNINEERLTHGFNDSDYIYLCSHGNYRNLMFVDIENIDLGNIIQHLTSYFKSHKIEALNLHDYYQQTLNDRQGIEYFTLRHIVRTYGEEFGLYFNGKSGVDNVSLNEVSERVTQRDVIVQALNQSKGTMTKAELAERLRSKSLGHAGYYLDELTRDNKVIRIDKMMYSTPKKAFENIDTDKILLIIKRLMQTTEKIVEADIFRQDINRELSLSYSKYFYAALIAINLDELGWYKRNMLISKDVIEYKNLLGIYKTVCLESSSNAENISKVQEIVWLSNSVANNVIRQWNLNK